MMHGRISRRNHYVPVWYQKGFICGSRTTLHYMDLDPSTITLPSGRIVTLNSRRLYSPQRCFRETDLYTTRFGPALNDAVERSLFGPIDRSGAKAVRAFADGHSPRIHETFQWFFEYLNAQKLRTPKGLDWIRTRYPTLTQGDLMQELQYLRHMHCTMWVECVREIVSAERSDVKFIVTDHPVTTFNPAFSPVSSACHYPEDPAIHLTGTQTVFALDAEHCIILTNLEYAKDPTGTDPLAPRPNTRYSGGTLARTDVMIRNRTLTSQEVVSINSLLASRARRYVAAYQKTWLLPENTTQVAWADIGQVLLPPRDGLWRFGGEVDIGYGDGSTQYQDAFGRTDASHKFLKKKGAVKTPVPDAPCGCGSGREYRKCCHGTPVDERPPWDVYGIRDRNRVLCNAVIDILGLSERQGWENLRRRLRDDQVKRIHEILSMLWPRDTNLAELLPRPDRRVFRAVHMGLTDPRTIALSVVSALAYFDEIVVLNPFPNPLYMRPEFSPTQVPGQHKSQMLKNVSLLLTLQPFMDAGMVHFVPDPTEFSASFRRALIEMTEKRTANWQPRRDEMQLGMALAEDDAERAMLRLPAAVLHRKLRENQPDLSQDQLEETLRYMKRRLADDPLALLQPVLHGNDGRDLQVFRSMSLELALFIAHLTGSAIYTTERAYWRQLHEHASAVRNAGRPSPWAPLSDKLDSLTLTFDANPRASLGARRAGKFGRMRCVLRRIWRAALAQGKEGDAEVGKVAMELAANLEAARARAERDWAECDTAAARATRLRGRMELSVPVVGFGMTSVHRLLVTFGRANFISPVPMSLFLAHGDVDEDDSVQED